MRFLGAIVTLAIFSASTQAATYVKSDSHQISCGYLRSAMLSDLGTEAKVKRAYEKATVYNSAPDDFMPIESKTPWAGNYFAMADGGIANRWQTAERGDYTLLHMDGEKVLTKAQVIEKIKAMPQSEIDRLSPAEKYDILTGKYKFPSTEWELVNRGSQRDPKPQKWEGFCNAMRAAGCLVPEPKNAIEARNKDGIKIRLEPADIKALVSATYFYVEKYQSLSGPNLDDKKDKNAPNPGTMHVALNHLALEGRFPMVVDSSNDGSEIWNETVIGYSRHMSEPESLKESDENFTTEKAQSAVVVTLKLRALGEIDMAATNAKTTHLVSSGQLGINDLDYQYRLYLDEDNKVVGGKWLSKEWPDFLWFPNGRGTDKENDGNPELSYRTIMKWVKESAQN